MGKIANMQDMSFDIALKSSQKRVNRVLGDLLEGQVRAEPRLLEAMRYSIEAGGKRIRAGLLFLCCELIAGAVNRDSEISAAAIEMVHTYSLIHDDLPAMDDDDLRRGKATSHIAFDEATAILAGDALLTLAFEVLCSKISMPELSVKLISELADAAGASGMIAGQMADLQAEKTGGNKEMLEYIHLNKTAKMFKAAAAMGAIAGGASERQYEILCAFGLKIGLGFQITDDILDVISTSGHLGKTAGKDEKAGKVTYPALIGIEESKALAEKLAGEAADLLVHFGEKAEVLKQLTVMLTQRTK